MFRRSLIKYDPPVLESAHKPKARTAKHTVQTEDILHNLLPPRKFEENGEAWLQHVSSAPATRLDVVNLQKRLDEALEARQARELGLCPVREELYAQLFDELIRQVTVECAERGVLLMRVRDEGRMTVAAYRALYESAIAYGMRKVLLSEQGRGESASKLAAAEAERAALQRQVGELRARLEASERRESDRRAVEERKHAEEVAFLRKQVAQLKTQLEAVFAQ
jgi:dynein light intermediate chain